MSLKPKVIKAQFKRTRSYTDTLVEGVSSYFSNWVTGNSNSPQDHKDIVTTAKFAEIQLIANQQPISCLLMGYNNGLQVWDLSLCSSKNVPDNNIIEIASLSGFRVRDFCIFDRLDDPKEPNSPAAASSSPPGQFNLERPLIGIISGEDAAHNSWPNTKLQLYSILNGAIVSSIDFSFPIISVLSNRDYIIVVFQNQAILLSPITFEKLFSVHLYCDGPRSGGVVDLGRRWLVYQCRQPLEDTMATTRLLHTQNLLSDPSNPEDGINESLSRSRKQAKFYLTSSDQLLWAFGSKIIDVTSYVRSYLNTFEVRGDLVTVASQDSPGVKEIGGYIMVIDLENPIMDLSELEDKSRRTKQSNFNIISHFKASSDGPLSIIKFDPTGTLLATASEKGNTINIYKINPKGVDIFDSHQHLYTLKRGVTPTIIKQITFSIDSKLVAITSAFKGTTHLYGINLQGGVVDAISHLDANNNRRVELQYTPSLQNILQGNTPMEPQYPAKLAVIRSDIQDVELTEELEKLFGRVVHFEIRLSTDYMVLCLDSDGTLTLHRIKLLEGETNKLELVASVQAVVEWELRRPTKSRGYRFQPSVYSQNKARSNSDTRNSTAKMWLSNIEIHTCTMPHTPFWMANDLLPLQAYTVVPHTDKLKFSDPIYQDEIYRTTDLAIIPVKESSQKLFSFY